MSNARHTTINAALGNRGDFFNDFHDALSRS